MLKNVNVYSKDIFCDVVMVIFIAFIIFLKTRMMMIYIYIYRLLNVGIDCCVNVATVEFL